MKITVETLVRAPLEQVWSAWNTPADIMKWNAAQEDWHTTSSTVDLREGGTFTSRMEAKDGSAGFDFEGTYTRVVPRQSIAYSMSDGRTVQVEFVQRADGVLDLADPRPHLVLGQAVRAPDVHAQNRPRR